jgi:hypothetical protein
MSTRGLAKGRVINALDRSSPACYIIRSKTKGKSYVFPPKSIKRRVCIREDHGQASQKHMRNIISTQNEKRRWNISDQWAEVYEVPDEAPKIVWGPARSKLSRHDGTSMRVSVLACLRVPNSPLSPELCLLLHSLVRSTRHCRNI